MEWVENLNDYICLKENKFINTHTRAHVYTYNKSMVFRIIQWNQNLLNILF